MQNCIQLNKVGQTVTEFRKLKILPINVTEMGFLSNKSRATNVLEGAHPSEANGLVSSFCILLIISVHKTRRGTAPVVDCICIAPFQFN